MSAFDPIRARIPSIPKSDMSRAEKDRATLLAVIDDILAISDIGMNSEHGDPAFIQGWECAIEEVKARIETAGEGDE